MNCYGVMPQPIKKNFEADKKKEGGGWGRPKTYVGDNAVKRALRISKSVLSRRELAEVLRCAWYHVIEQAEYDPASRFRVDRHVELHQKTRVVSTNVIQDENYGAHEYVRPVSRGFVKSARELRRR